MYADQQPPMGVPPGGSAPYPPQQGSYGSAPYANGEGPPSSAPYSGPPPNDDRHRSDFRDDRDYRDGRGRSRSPGPYRRAPSPRRGRDQPAPPPNPCLGVFGLSIRTRERDLEDEFSRIGPVEKVAIVYDQRTERSRGFAFVTMRSTEDATRAIAELNGIEMQGRNVRVDYSTTSRAHQPTPGEYMGFKRQSYSSYDSRSRRPPPPRGNGYDRGYERDDYDRYDRPRYRSRSPPRRREHSPHRDRY